MTTNKAKPELIKSIVDTVVHYNLLDCDDMYEEFVARLPSNPLMTWLSEELKHLDWQEISEMARDPNDDDVQDKKKNKKFIKRLVRISKMVANSFDEEDGYKETISYKKFYKYHYWMQCNNYARLDYEIHETADVFKIKLYLTDKGIKLIKGIEEVIDNEVTVRKENNELSFILTFALTFK